MAVPAFDPVRYSMAPAQQITPRVAVSAQASAPFALLPQVMRERLLAVLDHLSEVAEMVPASSPSWDRHRQACGALGLRFGPVLLRYRIEDSDASLVVEDVVPQDAS